MSREHAAEAKTILMFMLVRANMQKWNKLFDEKCFEAPRLLPELAPLHALLLPPSEAAGAEGEACQGLRPAAARGAGPGL